VATSSPGVGSLADVRVGFGPAVGDALWPIDDPLPGAWIALAVALLLAGMWAGAGWLARSGPQARPRIFAGLVAPALAVALGIGLAWPGGIATALAAVPGSGAGLGRLEYLRNTLTLIRDYPVVGAGLGGWMMLYSTYALLIHVGFDVHSHNMLLDVAVEQGLPALVVLVSMWVLFAWAVWRAMGQTRAPSGTRALYAAALSLVVVLIHGLVDDVLYGSRAVLLLFVPLAFAIPFPQARSQEDRQIGS
jgi:O-antigen ligase